MYTKLFHIQVLKVLVANVLLTFFVVTMFAEGVNVELRSFYFDGHSDREEYILGFDPSNADIDGDGLCDSLESYSYGATPSESDAPTWSLVYCVNLSECNSTLGIILNEVSQECHSSISCGITTSNVLLPPDYSLQTNSIG